MYLGRCPNPTCRRAFTSARSGSVNCPACGTTTLIVLDVAATVNPTPAVPLRRDDLSATVDGALAQPVNRPPVRPGLASTVDGPSAADTGLSAPGVAGTIGRFRVRAVLGAGAFGEVYRAHDPQLDREVALKVAKPGTLDSPERVGRFLREARAAANLRHPHIVPVFDSGRDGTRHYIASGFIDGRTLEAEIDDAGGEPLDLRRAAAVVRKLAEALGYAHKQGVVHRDVKPANVLVDAAGEPSLTDFGLAVRAGDEVVKTQDGRVMGTPAYMSPEQAAGRSAEATAASDQYALGVMLYEMTTGRRPFEGPMEVVIVQQIQVEPRCPRSENRLIPKDLETVILKCLEKRPEQRYPTCEALAEDLRRFLGGEPVTARRVGPVERLGRWAKRNPTIAGSLAFGVLALLIGSAVSAWQANVATRAAATAADQKKIAEDKAEEALAATKLANAEKLRAEDETNKARQQLRRAETVSGFMRDLFIASDPTGLTGSGLIPPGEGGRTVSASELLTRGARQIGDQLKDDPLTRATLLGAIGEVSRSLGLSDQSFPMLSEALALRRRHLPVDHPDVTASVFHLANWHSDKGNFIESEKLYLEALATHRRRGTLETLEAADIQMRLAVLYCWISDGRSIEVARASLATREKLLGPKHRDTATARVALAASILDAADEEDEAAFREALRQVSDGLEFLKSTGTDQKDGVLSAALECQNGIFLSFMRFDTQAEKKYRLALDQMLKAVGPNHIYTHFLRYMLAGVLNRKGNLTGAEQLYKEWFAGFKATIGVEHPRAVSFLGGYTNFLVKTERPKEAYALASEVLRAVESRYGKSVWWRHRHLAECARLASLAGEKALARAHVSELLATLSDPTFVPDARHPVSLARLARDTTELKEPELTRKVYTAAFAHERAHPRAIDRWALNQSFGGHLTGAKNYAEAVPHLREAARVYQENPKIASVKGNRAGHAFCLNCQGVAAWGLGRYAESESFFRECVTLSRQEERGSDQHREALELLAVLLAVQKRFTDLSPVLESYLELTTISATDRAWATALRAVALDRTGDRTAAAGLLERLEKRLGGSADPDVAGYRGWAVWATGGNDAVRIEIGRMEKLAAQSKLEDVYLELSACYLRANRPADALATLTKFGASNTFGPAATFQSTLKAYAEYRKDVNETTRARLRAAAQRAERYLQTFTSRDPDYRWYDALMLGEVAVLCERIRAELPTLDVAPPPRAAPASTP